MASADPASTVADAMAAASISDAKEVEFKPEEAMDAASLSKANAIAASSEAATFSSLGLYARLAIMSFSTASLRL
jgi:hypothetical protein